MTEQELQDCCRFWQQALRLQDVQIEVRFVRKLELDATGQTTLRSDNNGALIQVCPQSLANLDTLWSLDEEVILVHELLHVQERVWACAAEWKEFKKSVVIHSAHEAGIERTAEALVALRRKLFLQELNIVKS